VCWHLLLIDILIVGLEMRYALSSGSELQGLDNSNELGTKLAGVRLASPRNQPFRTANESPK
jgi:hypothetical protein